MEYSPKCSTEWGILQGRLKLLEPETFSGHSGIGVYHLRFREVASKCMMFSRANHGTSAGKIVKITLCQGIAK
jgi:hypothetical protein